MAAFMRKEGSALVVVTLTILLVLMATAIVMARLNSTKRQTDIAITQTMLEQVCQAGIDAGIAQLWENYLSSGERHGVPGDWESYREFLDEIVENNEDLNGNGREDDDEEDLNGDGNFEKGDPAVLIDESDGLNVGAGRLVLLTVSRSDDITGTMLTLRAVGEVTTSSSMSQRQTVARTVRVSGELFNGPDFALLVNNMNCILCHAQISSIDLQEADSPDDYVRRVRVGTLESLLYRTGEAHSNVAGAVYTRGEVYNSNGSILDANGIRNSTFKGYRFDGPGAAAPGNIVRDATGQLAEVDFLNAGKDADDYYLPFENLYKNYPSEGEYMTDGNLPSYFPAPYADDGAGTRPTDAGNRVVDTTEFAAVMNRATGSITGGVVYGLSEGGFYAGSGLPMASGGDSIQGQNVYGDSNSKLTGAYNGNLILVGTEANPIEIDGRIAVNGDLVIKGPVKGQGQLLVRGNSYVVGDVTYADADIDGDGATDFGRYGPETGEQNGLALISGGSILMGDYLTVRGKNPDSQDSAQFPDKSYSVRVRQEHYSKGGIDIGYFSDDVIDPGHIVYETDGDGYELDADGNRVIDSGRDPVLANRDGQQFSFTTSELMLFNKLEIDKAVADPSYVPRLYGLRESQSDPSRDLWVYDGTEEHAVHYMRQGVYTLSEYLIKEDIPLEILDRATIHYMNPKSNWISEEQLRQMWWDDEMSRTSRYTPFKFDGVLYSNNAIFAITRSYARHRSNSDGIFQIRGAMISPDLGVLVPGNGGTNDRGLELHYDPRAPGLMRLEDPARVSLQRLFYVRESREMVTN